MTDFRPASPAARSAIARLGLSCMSEKDAQCVPAGTVLRVEEVIE